MANESLVEVLIGSPLHTRTFGSTANRMMRSAAEGEVCITVTLLDGLVLARSAFHHSVNYRSVVIYGRGEVVTDPAEKDEALRLTVEHAIPGRWDDVRPPNREEHLRTLVVRVSLDEASNRTCTQRGVASVRTIGSASDTPVRADSKSVKHSGTRAGLYDIYPIQAAPLPG